MGPGNQNPVPWALTKAHALRAKEAQRVERFFDVDHLPEDRCWQGILQGVDKNSKPASPEARDPQDDYLREWSCKEQALVQMI